MKKTVFFVLFFICSEALLFSQTVSFPSNVGGKSEFKRVFEQELVYPEKALTQKIGGKVTFNFIVQEDGSVTDLILFDSLSPELNAEAKRLFNLYQWVPALKGGTYVSGSHTVTFDFNPAKYHKICRERGFEKFQYLPNVQIDSSSIVYQNPEQAPMYEKGNYLLSDFIKENLEYPHQAQLANIQGTVILRFVVEPSGLPTNIDIENSIGAGCDQEAIRILKMIKWYPAKQKGKLVRAQMTFPFRFILNEDFKDNSMGEQK